MSFTYYVIKNEDIYGKLKNDGRMIDYVYGPERFFITHQDYRKPPLSVLDTLRHPRRELLSNIIREQAVAVFDWQAYPCNVFQSRQMYISEYWNLIKFIDFYGHTI